MECLARHTRNVFRFGSSNVLMIDVINVLVELDVLVGEDMRGGMLEELELLVGLGVDGLALELLYS